MPAAYEAMRDSFAAKGMNYDAAQAKAAAIYNSTHKSAPVTAKDALVKKLKGEK